MGYQEMNENCVTGKKGAFIGCVLAILSRCQSFLWPLKAEGPEGEQTEALLSVSQGPLQ